MGFSGSVVASYNLGLLLRRSGSLNAADLGLKIWIVSFGSFGAGLGLMSTGGALLFYCGRDVTATLWIGLRAGGKIGFIK